MMSKGAKEKDIGKQQGGDTSQNTLTEVRKGVPSLYRLPPGWDSKDYYEWLISVPQEDLYKEIERYRNQVAVDLYNYDFETQEQREQFWNKYEIPPIHASYRTPEVKEQIIQGERNLIVVEQPYYRTIVDKAINGERITEDELKRINERVYGWIYQEQDEKSGRCVLIESFYAGFEGILRAAYEWVYRVSNRSVEVGRCAAEDCHNIFVPYKSGREQQFCSDRCYKRTYMRKRRRRGKESFVNV